ncbi:hypothetical protein MNV49_001583 [Pseudohyphozyma bogoriensis]|nr:hypothetical protein MNV49_001583 [Pseudohyphozyma bogoriensis]
MQHRTPKQSSVAFPAKDGFVLSATIYSSPNGTGASRKPLVVFAPATGTTQPFYSSFALYLASHGLVALTFDYRYTGNSWPPSTPLDASKGSKAARIEILKRERETKLDEHWAWDLAAAVDEGARRATGEGRELVVLAHSLGGHILPLLPPSVLAPVARVLFVAVCSPYHGFYGGLIEERKRDVGALLKAADELGYFPSRQGGLGTEVPFGCGVQWSLWMDYENYWAVDHQSRLDEYVRPTLALSFTDDWIAIHVKQIDAILDVLPNAPSIRVHLNPSTLGWPEVMKAWLESGIAPALGAGERREFGPERMVGVETKAKL